MWEPAEYISTAVVFIGCVGEFFAEFTRFPKGESDKHKLARLSLILVIAGIAGELCATVRTSQLSGQVIASIEDEAELANQEAGKANVRAGNAAKRAAELLAEIQPRDLTIEQQKAIGNALRSFSGHFVLITMYSLDQESVRLGMLIEAALKYGGIETQLFPNPAPGLSTLPMGVRVTGSDNSFVNGLKKVLASEGQLTLSDPNWHPLRVAGASVGILLPKASQAQIFVRIKPLKMVK